MRVRPKAKARRQRQGVCTLCSDVKPSPTVVRFPCSFVLGVARFPRHHCDVCLITNRRSNHRAFRQFSTLGSSSVLKKKLFEIAAHAHRGNKTKNTLRLSLTTPGWHLSEAHAAASRLSFFHAAANRFSSGFLPSQSVCIVLCLDATRGA